MPKRKLPEDELRYSFEALHNRLDDFLELIQLKASLRLLRDDDNIDKEKLEYAEEIISTRINNILDGVIPKIQKRPPTLRELDAATIEADLLLKLMMTQEYVFHLVVAKEGKQEEILISPKDMLYITPVPPPFKWKLSSIELKEGADDVRFNLIFGQGIMETVNASATTGFAITTYTSTGSEPNSDATAAKKKFYLYSLWCGSCSDFSYHGLPIDATHVDTMACMKCKRPLLTPWSTKASKSNAGSQES